MLRKAIEEEQRSLTGAQQLITEIEEALMENLMAVGVPGVDSEDRAVINIRTWMPKIQNRNDPRQFWDFDSAGSNGRRVLFTVCYAIAIHQVAERHGLPIPSILLLDTPTKDVARDANQEIHDAMQQRIAQLTSTSLKKTQLIVADSSFVQVAPVSDYRLYELSRQSGLIKYYHD
ncbi:MAG TPA: hypothetical protein VGF98_14605 [Candidatus Tumulicola sp.]|jgi:hypothetical protein